MKQGRAANQSCQHTSTSSSKLCQQSTSQDLLQTTVNCYRPVDAKASATHNPNCAKSTRELTVLQMLSRRIVRASPFRTATLSGAPRRLPFIQHRTFLPESMVGRINEKYPDSDYPKLTPEEDPDMVCSVGGVATRQKG